MPTTPRWDHRYPVVGDTPHYNRDLGNLAADLDNVGKDDSGPLANRPASSPGSPGKRGRYYWATDEATLYRDNGTGWNAVGLRRCAVRAYATANHDIVANSWQGINFGAALYDDDPPFHMWEGTDPPDIGFPQLNRLTCKFAGYYKIWARANWEADPGGPHRLCRIFHNGANSMAEGGKTAASAAGGANWYSRIWCSTTMFLAVNDYIELQVYQDQDPASGGVNVFSYITPPNFNLTSLEMIRVAA